MSRLLFWLALAVLVVFAIRSKIRAARLRAEQAARAGGHGGQRAQAAPLETSEAMSCCAHCGLYFPAAEAVRADGRDYCCPAHVRPPAQ